MLKYLFIHILKQTFFSNLTDFVSKKIDENVRVGEGEGNREKMSKDKENICCDNVPRIRRRKQRRKAGCRTQKERKGKQRINVLNTKICELCFL